MVASRIQLNIIRGEVRNVIRQKHMQRIRTSQPRQLENHTIIIIKLIRNIMT